MTIMQDRPVITHTGDRAELITLSRLAAAYPNSDATEQALRLTPLTATEFGPWWAELGDAVAQLDGLEDGTVHWSEVIPDAEGSDRDGQALDAARTRVDLALDALTAVTR